jgi:hypothetical protein
LGFYKRNDGSRICKDNKHAAEIAINAGSDMDMESSAYVDHLVALVKEGKVKESLVDDAETYFESKV